MVAKDAILPLQTALHALLVADPGLIAIIGTRVHDEVPQNQVFPYIIIGEFDSTEWRTMGDNIAGSRHGEEIILTIHIWSTKQGFKEAHEIHEELHRLLTDKDDSGLTIAGFDLNFIMYASTDTIKEVLKGGRVARHVIARWRVKLQQT